MAVDKVQQRWAGIEAGEDLTGKQFTLVKITSSNTVVAAASGDSSYVLLEPKKKGYHPTICIGGVAKIKVGTEVKVGELVGGKNDGTIQPAASGQYIVGAALATGKAGSYVPVLVHPGTGAKA